MIDEDQAAAWKAELDAARTHGEWIQIQSDWDARRTPEVIAALRDHLERFLSGQISLKQFQADFDRKTRTQWDAFGLKGLSGAMFLNTLIKHMPDQQRVADVLKRTVTVPSNESDARSMLSGPNAEIESAVLAGDVKKSQVQSARANFFLSVWWHIQERELWPAYYVSMRRVLAQRGVWKPQQADFVEDYLSYREAVLNHTQSLRFDLWTLEH
jgi:hypothetical protein